MSRPRDTVEAKKEQMPFEYTCEHGTFSLDCTAAMGNIMLFHSGEVTVRRKKEEPLVTTTTEPAPAVADAPEPAKVSLPTVRHRPEFTWNVRCTCYAADITSPLCTHASIMTCIASCCRCCTEPIHTTSTTAEGEKKLWKVKCSVVGSEHEFFIKAIDDVDAREHVRELCLKELKPQVVILDSYEVKIHE